MESPEQQQTQSATPQWLLHLQRNSWEPEIIISGIMLAFIFAFPAQVYEFTAALIQEYGLHFLGAFVLLLYISIVINVFKFFFIAHLLLRFFWAGMLGVSYAFPKGVIVENLFKLSQRYQYSHPDKMVLKIERFCSMAFGLPTILGIVLVIISAYLGLLLGIQAVFRLHFFSIYLLFISTMILFALAYLLFHKARFFQWMGNSMYSSVSSIYQSNLGKWSILAYVVLVAMLAIPGAMSDTHNFVAFYSDQSMATQDDDWLIKSHYISGEKPVQRMPRAFITHQEVKGKWMMLSLAHYKSDDYQAVMLNTHFSRQLDSLHWKTIKTQADIYRIYINDSLITTDQWLRIQLPGTEQKVFQTMVPVEWLAEGIHQVRIERIMAIEQFTSTTPKFIHRKQWYAFPFTYLKEY
jgi:hypothetical protein